MVQHAVRPFIRNRRGKEQRARLRWTTPSAIHEDGYLRMREHLDRLAAENNRCDTATSVGGHQDQIAPSRFGGFDNCLIDLFVLGVERLAFNTG